MRTHMCVCVCARARGLPLQIRASLICCMCVFCKRRRHCGNPNHHRRHEQYPVELYMVVTWLA